MYEYVCWVQLRLYEERLQYSKNVPHRLSLSYRRSVALIELHEHAETESEIRFSIYLLTPDLHIGKYLKSAVGSYTVTVFLFRFFLLLERKEIKTTIDRTLLRAEQFETVQKFL